jgi:predicted ATPase/DNA-binding XRE family transcriptional regulator
LAEVSFGGWLKRRRGAKGWTQKQLAQRINCSVSALRKMEAEERRPSAQIVQQLAEIFEIPQDEHKSFLRFARGDWQAISSRETEDAPWHGSQVASPSNLPLSMTSFIGREKEMDEVVNLIAKNRLVTIVGAGGIGKTRVSQQVGQKLLNNYPNGVWFVTLDSLSDAALVPQTVASVFDIREGSSDQPLIERLMYSLRAKTTLLILDNCEHLLDACAQLIMTLLTHCPNLKVLTTSREIFNMEGEAIYLVPTLSIPEQGELSLEKISDYESIQLFMERATLVLSSFYLTTNNMQTAVDICRRVDSIPLAIEMAAARVDILQVDEILRQLNHCFDLLVGKNRTAPLRHQTMRASIDWSWGLLTQSEQVFMRQLSVFAGGWTLESAQIVCDGDALDPTSALVKKSLIAVNQEAGRETRYRFHEFVRQYMHEKLFESGEEKDTQSRHLHYFLHLAEQAEPAQRGPTQVEWMSRLNDEHDNIRAALGWANKTDVEAGLYICGRLGQFWEEYDLHEGERWLSKFLETSRSQAYPHARAKALYAYGVILNATQQFFLLEKVAEECLALYRRSGDPSGEIDSLVLLAISMSHSHNSTRALELTQQALNISDSIGDIWRKAFALAHMGWLEGADYKKRASYWYQAIGFFRKAGDLRLLEDYLGVLGDLEVSNGDFESAQKNLDEAFQWRQSLKRKGGMGFILNALSRVEAIKGNFEKARSFLEEDLAIQKDLGHRMKSLWDRTLLGHLFVYQGKISEARDIFFETIQEFFKDKEEMGVAFNLEGLASLYATTGRPEISAQLIGWADTTREKNSDPRPLLEQADVDKIVTACLAKMGEVAFSDAYDEGRKMTMDEAVAFALEET